MSDKPDMNMHASDDGSGEPSFDYLARAREADESGDFLLSMYLYMAAFQKSINEASQPAEDAIFGLKQAWALACANKERSLAEYIFELMEPYLSSDEITLCADELQNLALDKLEEFGLTREDLEDMAQMITDDLMGEVGPIVKVDQVFSGTFNPTRRTQDEAVPADGIAAGNAPSTPEQSQDIDQTEIKAIAGEVQTVFEDEEEPLNYENIAGYETTVSIMRDLGIGMSEDPYFKELVGMLNVRHGLQKRPAPDSMMFRSHVREDANRFMLATLGELGVPAVNMRMEENFQGMPVLCISAHAMELPPASSFKEVFKNGGALVLEDLDLWEAPSTDFGEDSNAFLMMQMTRGAREAVNLIRSAVENPDVYVIATASIDGAIDEYFLEMLEPMSLIDIDYPNEEERASIWMDIAKEHPSIRSINRRDLVKYSANLARFDIYMASREAIEEAYKIGLMTRKYQPVSRENMFDKLAAYQPLESEEYTELEDEVVRDFQSDLNHIDDILDE